MDCIISNFPAEKYPLEFSIRRIFNLNYQIQMLKHLSLILFLVIFIQKVSFGTGAVIINEAFENAPLKEVLQILRKNYKLKIAFSDRNVRGISVNTNLKDLSLQDSFIKILENTGLTFELLDGKTIIIKKKPKEVQSPSLEIKGVISDAETGENLPYATLWTEEDQKSFLANEEGYFLISNASQIKKIRVSYLGYQDTVLEISNENQFRRLNIGLTAKFTDLEEYVLSDQEIDHFSTAGPAGKVTYNPINARQTPALGEVDVFRSLQLLPGVNATNEVSSGLSITGGTSNQNLVLFDGFTVYHVDHFFGYFSAFNPNAIQSVRLFKGGFDAKYGGRVSSVVDISGKDGNRNETKGSLGFNLLSVNTSLEIPLSDNGTTLFFSGRRSYTDIWSSSLFENIFSVFESSLLEDNKLPLASKARTISNEVKPNFYYSDLNFKISSKVGAKNQLSFSFYDSNDALDYTENSLVQYRDTLSVSTRKIGLINWGNVGSSLNFSRQWNTKHYTSALASYSFYESSFQEIGNSEISSKRWGDFITVEEQEQLNNIQDITFKVDHEWIISNTSTLETGISASIYDNKLNYVANDSTLVNKVESNEFLLAHYLQGSFALTNSLTITPGIRTNYLSTTSELYIEPRFSFLQKINSNLNLKGATGIYHQYLNQSNTKNALEGNRDFWILANGKNVPVQRAWHGMLGLEYSRNNTLFTLNLFQKNFNGLTEYAFRNGSLITQFEDNNRVFTTGDGIAKGIEMMLKKDLGKFSSWISYTLSEVKYQFPKINLGRAFYADHDQRHEINWFGVYAVQNFEFSATWIYGSGKPYTVYEEILNRQPDTNSKGPEIIVLNIPERNGARLPAYHRMDLSARYFINLGKSKANLALSIFNLYNRENILDTKVSVIAPKNPRNNRDRIITTSNIPLMGITPNLSFEIKF